MRVCDEKNTSMRLFVQLDEQRLKTLIQNTHFDQHKGENASLPKKNFYNLKLAKSTKYGQVVSKPDEEMDDESNVARSSFQ